ncbi:MAG: tetratricopeptide repeat protein [Cyclobacteriaceae bacterium]
MGIQKVAQNRKFIARHTVLLIIAIFFSQSVHGQLFKNAENVRLVTRSVNFIYSMQSDSALYYAERVEEKIPQHPVVPMLRAVNLMWQTLPYVTVDTTFEKFKKHLYEVVEKAIAIDGGKQKNTEAIFFEMAARGLLSEYYADTDNYMKAVNEASKAYGLLKKAFDMTEEISDFLFAVGIYNYFREAYPEKYPVYKSFVWVFRNGDKSKGIQQLKLASEKALIVNIEATMYLAYLYLRYEYKPALAQDYLRKLVIQFPKNSYIRTKYLESVAIDPRAFSQAKPHDFQMIASDGRLYYSVAAFAFEGLYHEWTQEDYQKAEELYKRALSIGSSLKDRGEYLKSLCYLGLGRIHQSKGDLAMAKYYLGQAKATAETADIKTEAQERLDNLGD